MGIFSSTLLTRAFSLFTTQTIKNARDIIVVEEESHRHLRIEMEEQKIKMSLISSCSSGLSINKNTMPDDKTSLHRSFNQLLGSLDLPSDKIEEMNSYDDHKKWEILCSRSLMKAHQSPGAYLERLRSHVGLKISPSKDILRGLEVSLRTYTIGWLHDFLASSNSLDTLAVLASTLSNDEEHFHILLKCLRALLNDSFGCEKIINHVNLLQMLVVSLRDAHEKNRVMILQLLAHVCRKSMDGQGKILKLLKATNGMQRTLIEFLSVPFSSTSNTHQLVVAATLKLVNTLLTSITDLNHAVYLQYDFHKIGWDNRIERLMLNESNLIPEVIDEITAYKSIIINVNQLIKDHDGVETLKEQLENAKAKIMEMEKQLINYEKSQEVKKKDGPVSEEPKVDKIQEVARKSEISKKGDVVTSRPPPLPPPPPSPFGLMPIKRKIVTKCKLPTLHWTILRPNQIRGTIFNGHNDEQLRKLINFTHFENKFGIVDSKTMQSLRRIKTAKYTTLLEPQRLRNVAILRHKLNADADVVARAINNYDFNQLNADNVEVLMSLAPKENEIDVYRNHVLDPSKTSFSLSEEDKFLMRLALVERLPTKLSCIQYMVNFDDQMSSLEHQLSSISSASLSLKCSKNFQTLMEIILTFGNYMNGGFVYGFRLKGTLEKLTATRSNDKQQTLLQYIVTEVIVQHFPHLLSLDTELVCINEAARISMKNVATEVENIERGWRRVKCENQLSMCSALRTFIENANEKCNKLMNEFENGKSNYKECCAFLGENCDKIDSDEFFSMVRNFMSEYVSARSII